MRYPKPPTSVPTGLYNNMRCIVRTSERRLYARAKEEKKGATHHEQELQGNVPHVRQALVWCGPLYPSAWKLWCLLAVSAKQCFEGRDAHAIKLFLNRRQWRVLFADYAPNTFHATCIRKGYFHAGVNGKSYSWRLMWYNELHWSSRDSLSLLFDAFSVLNRYWDKPTYIRNSIRQACFLPAILPALLFTHILPPLLDECFRPTSWEVIH